MYNIAAPFRYQFLSYVIVAKEDSKNGSSL